MTPRPIHSLAPALAGAVALIGMIAPLIAYRRRDPSLTPHCMKRRHPRSALAAHYLKESTGVIERRSRIDKCFMLFLPPQGKRLRITEQWTCAAQRSQIRARTEPSGQSIEDISSSVFVCSNAVGSRPVSLRSHISAETRRILPEARAVGRRSWARKTRPPRKMV